MRDKGAIRSKIGQYAFWPIAKMQMMVDIPTWLGAYEKGLARFEGNEAQAIDYADEVLIQAQSSGLMKDLAGFERGTLSEGTRLSPLVRLFTTFYSYFNTKLNLAYEQTKKTNFRKPSDVARLASDYLLLFWVEAILGEMLLGRAPDEDDDEDPLVWGAKLGLKNMAATIPLVREVSGLMDGFSGVGATKGLGDIAKGATSVYNLANAATSEEEDVDLIKAVQGLNSAAGVIFKLPSSQINQILRTIDAANRGEEVAPIDYLIYRKQQDREVFLAPDFFMV